MTGKQPTPPAGDLTRLRQINERAILDVVRSGGTLRAAEIADRTGLTRASVVDVLKALTAKGWIALEAPTIAGRGRPAVRYRFRGEAGLVVGIDIGAHTIRVVLVDLTGAVLASTDRTVTPDLSRRSRLTAVARLVDECLAAAGAEPEQVWLNVAGSTGRVDPPGRIAAASAIPDWAGLDLYAALRRRLPGGRVLVENDVRLATVAEQRRGAARDVEDLILVQAGRRTGLGIVLDGNLRTGHGNVAGDLSPYNAVSCDDAYRLIERCRIAPSARSGDHVSDVLKAAARGDARATAAVGAYTRAIAAVTSTAVSLLDPELVVLGGVLASYSDVVLPTFAAELAARCMRAPRVCCSRFGPEAVAVGAAWRGLDAVGDRILPFA